MVSSQDLNRSVFLIAGGLILCNVARPNQDIFPADSLVKNCPGMLLPSVKSKTLHCHRALPTGEGRELGVLCSMRKLTGVKKASFQLRQSQKLSVCQHTHTFTPNPKPNIATFIIFYHKWWLNWRCINFLFSQTLPTYDIEGTETKFFISETLPCLLHKQTKIPPEQKCRTQLPHVYQNIVSISPPPSACACDEGLIKRS